MTLRYRSGALGVAAFFAAGMTAAVFATSGAAKDDVEPATEGTPAVARRISADQYQQIIRDLFGRSVKIDGRFEPDVRANGLLALGAPHISVTATGFEWYDSLARGIADQVVSESFRDSLLPCRPKSTTAADEACAREALAGIGQFLYRRPLEKSEVDRLVGDAGASATKLKSFYAGLAHGLTSLLQAPEFLFRIDAAEPDPSSPGAYRLDAYSKASQLSFFLWNTAPDRELLRAAANGELHTQKGLTKQVDRMVASPRLETGVRAFFSDMLALEHFAELEKDATLYPKFITQVSRDSQEQLLRTVVDHLLTRSGDYRDLFTTPHTFLTPILAANYGVPVPEVTPNGALEAWVSYDFPKGDARAGLLAQAGFVALHSHPGRSSPTIRGRAVRELILCQKVPDPPGNVNFTVVQDTNNPSFRTARERLSAHATEAMCTGCHKITDPIGLAMETFSTAGEYRTSENGARIETNGVLDGKIFTDTVGLFKVVHDHPGLPSCLVNRTFAYASGRVPASGDADYMKYLTKTFADSGYKFPALMRSIALSKGFMLVSAPQQTASVTK